MENQIDPQGVAPQNNEVETTEAKPETEVAPVEETTEEPKEEKPTETPEQRVARLRRQLEREEKKLGIKKEEPKKTKKASDELDYSEKAYLKASGIDSAEFEFVKDQMAESGIKDIDRLLENNYFKAQLKEFREAKTVEKATPKSARVSTGESPTLKVDYWLAKGELPPNTPEYQQLRREVVNARYTREKSGNNFSSNPIVQG